MIIDTEPSPVNSVHRPIVFVYDFAEGELNYVTDSGGFARFNTDVFAVPPVIGAQIYVTGGTYAGYHTVTAIGGADITTSTAYISNQTDYAVKSILIPEVKIYSGYDSGEEYPTELPLTLLATFTPVTDINVQISFDVAGYLKPIFSIVPPSGTGVDFNLFNRFRLYLDDVEQDTYQVVNAAIDTDVLNEIYVGTGVYLSSSTTQIIFQCGLTILSMLDIDGVVTNTEVVNGDTGADYYYDDYDDNDYLTQNS